MPLKIFGILFRDRSSEAFQAARDLMLRMGEKHLVRWWRR